MTLIELMVTSTVLVVLLGMVFVSMNLINSVSSSVTSQFQEFDQALPAMAPFHSLLAAEVEPGPTDRNDADPRVRGFQSIGNFSMTFYANIGTAYDNTTSCPTGPTCTTGAPPPDRPRSSPRNSTAAGCSPATPCSRRQPVQPPAEDVPTGDRRGSAPGVSTCPGVGTGPACQWSTDYRLLANVLDVVNNPSAVDGSLAPTEPIFSYTIFDPNLNQAIPPTSYEIQHQMLTGLSNLGYTVDTQSLSACDAPTSRTGSPRWRSTRWPSPARPTPSRASTSTCRVAKPGTSANTIVDEQPRRLPLRTESGRGHRPVPVLGDRGMNRMPIHDRSSRSQGSGRAPTDVGVGRRCRTWVRRPSSPCSPSPSSSASSARRSSPPSSSPRRSSRPIAVSVYAHRAAPGRARTPTSPPSTPIRPWRSAARTRTVPGRATGSTTDSGIS